MEGTNRVSIDPKVMGGHPCIRGTRVTVGTVVGLLAQGNDTDEVLRLYPYLHRDDVAAALSYAAWRADKQQVVVVAG